MTCSLRAGHITFFFYFLPDKYRERTLKEMKTSVHNSQSYVIILPFDAVQVTEFKRTP